MGDPNRSLTADERALFMRDLNIVHQNFVEAVAQNRNLPIRTVRSFADGATVLGSAARSIGLIDAIGDNFDAENYLSQKTREPVHVCW